MRFSSLLLLTGLAAATSFGRAAAQNVPGGTTAATVRKHLVYFRDKTGTPFTVA